MANECVRTKFNGVLGGNLPCFSTIFIDVLSHGDVTAMTLYLETGDDSINIDSAYGFRVNSTGSSVVTHYTLASDSQCSIILTNTDSPNGAERFIKISGGIYTIKKLISEGPYKLNGENSGILSLKYSNDLYAFGGLGANSIDTNDMDLIWYTLDKESTGNTNIPDVKAYNSTQDAYGTLLSINLIKDFVKVETIMTRLSGDFKDLPKNTKVIYTSTSATRGDLADFVSKARSLGRADGYLALSIGYKSNANCKLNGVALSVVNPPTVDNNFIILTWDSTTASFTDTAPQGFDAAKLASYWTSPANLDENV